MDDLKEDGESGVIGITVFINNRELINLLRQEYSLPFWILPENRFVVFDVERVPHGYEFRINQKSPMR